MIFNEFSNRAAFRGIEILLEQQPPQGVFVCDHAGLVINTFSQRREVYDKLEAAHHPAGNPGANLKSISHRCYLFEVAFVRELTKETIVLPLGCLQGGMPHTCPVTPPLGLHPVFAGVAPRTQPWRQPRGKSSLLLLYSRYRSWKVLEP